MSIAQTNKYRQEILLQNDWKFIKRDDETFKEIDFDDQSWQHVTVPHDWAIQGPFDKKHDLQEVAIFQDGEKKATEKSGRTGALPYVGTGWYRRALNVDNFEGKQILLQFDGAMSEAQVFINGKKVGEHPYGYAYFYFDITFFLNKNGKNTLAVRLHNEPKSSRWYPGAGIYRNVTLISKHKSSFEQWGTTITTPFITDDVAKVVVNSLVQGNVDKVKVEIRDANNNIVANKEQEIKYGQAFETDLKVEKPLLWSPESPTLYKAKITAYQKGEIVDQVQQTFGIRTISYTRENAFQLNGVTRKFKGVCLHHDLGPLGIAVNRAALKRQLVIMKEMGADAIRTAHNMPSIEQMELCDELGLMVIAESFDEWKKPKVDNGYHRFFDDWAQKDVENLVRRLKNHPSIVMWSAGNEVPDQFGSVGVKRAAWLQDIFHKEDPTRPVTVGMDQVKADFKVVCNGDATSLEMFHHQKMKTFNGKLVVTVQSQITEGNAILEIKGKGLKTAKIELEVKKASEDLL